MDSKPKMNTLEDEKEEDVGEEGRGVQHVVVHGTTGLKQNKEGDRKNDEPSSFLENERLSKSTTDRVSERL